ncbi:MAG: thioredoxin [Bacteroidales bacterium]|nr:thioredoxin [Bacteroidales bacterium]
MAKNKGSQIFTIAAIILIGAGIAWIVRQQLIDDEPNPEPGGKNLVTLTDQNVEKVTGNGVVLIDFWAEWCQPCRIQGPIVEEVANEMSGRDQVTIAKLDIDSYRSIAAKYKIQVIPTIVILKDGKEVEKLRGVQKKEKLIETLNKYADTKNAQSGK